MCQQAWFAVPHSSLTIGLVGLGLGWDPEKIVVLDRRKIVPTSSHNPFGFFPTGPSVAILANRDP